MSKEFSDVLRRISVSHFYTYFEFKGRICSQMNLKRSTKVNIHTSDIVEIDLSEHSSSLETAVMMNGQDLKDYESQLKVGSGYKKVYFNYELKKYPELNGKIVFWILEEKEAHLLQFCENNHSRFIELLYRLNGRYQLARSLVISSSLLTEKTLEVLERLSLGLSRNEIAHELLITSRGVDYHIEIAKSSLHTETIPATIYKASLFGLFPKLN